MENVFVISVEDVQSLAIGNLGRQLTEKELYHVKRGIEFGLDCWVDVVVAALEEVKRSDL